MGRNAKRKSKPASDPKVPKRSRNHRTKQTPWEAAREDEDLVVEKITAKEWRKGAPFYLVQWEGFAATEATWEPAQNLVGATETVREFNDAKAAADRIHKEKIIEAKRKAKQDREAKKLQDEEAAIAAAIAAASQEGSADPDQCQPCGGTFLINGRPVHDKHRRKKATVYDAYDLSTECIVCNVDSNGQPCGFAPKSCGGTTNFWGHLYCHHRTEWLRLKKKDGALTEVGEVEYQVLKTSLDAKAERDKTSLSKTKLDTEGQAVLHRLAAEAVVYDDRDFSTFATPAFKAYADAMSGGAHDGADARTIKSHVSQMAVKGRENGAETVALLLKDGMKVTISADLWSKNGCALLGILFHGILRQPLLGGKYKWCMVEKLAGAVPCRDSRHTGEYVFEASIAELEKLGIDDPNEQVFRGKTDRGSNMVKGYEKLKHDPCCDHLLETSIGVYTSHASIKPVIVKGRAQVGYFNSSTIGNSDLNKYQRQCGLPKKSLVQDVLTRWRSTFSAQNSLRENMQPLLVYDVNNADPAKSWQENKFDTTEWQINNQSSAVLAPLAEASTILEGKKYPTSSLVFAYVYGAIATLAPGTSTMQPWDSQLLHEFELHPAVKEARSALYADMHRRWVTEMEESQWAFYAIACLCDPRFLALLLPLFTPEMRERAYKLFVDEYNMNYAPVCDDSPSSDSSEAASSEAPTPVPAAATPRTGSLESFMHSISHVTPVAAPAPAADAPAGSINQARAYLDSGPAQFSTDPLEWWSDNESRFPNLARMAQQYLGCPATSASAERVFSLAGRLYSDLRQHMADVTLEERMWAKVNRYVH